MRVAQPSLGERAKGKWAAILPALGVDKAFLTGRHGPCPICAPGGAGTDRFRFDNKDGKGTFYCSQCGAGDGIELVKRLKGWDFKQAAPEIEKLLGGAPAIAVRNGRDIEEVRRDMNDIWRGGKPLSEVEATHLWWVVRVGSVPSTTELRAVRSLRCPGHPDMPGMVARVVGPDGKPVSLHRTYLTDDGQKADIPEPRRVMDCPMPKGSTVRLHPAEESLGIAEGIETAEAARLLFGIPVWAGLNAENMKGFVPPLTVRRIVIFGDPDHSFTGQAAAFELARRLWVKRKDWSPDLIVEVNINGLSIDRGALGHDWNDVWNRKQAEGLVAPHREGIAA